MNTRRIAWISGQAALLALGLPAAAQQGPVAVEAALQELQTSISESQPDALQPTGLTTSDVALDLMVPVSPAFTALDVTPDSVVRPTSPRELALALLNGVDPNGNFQTGLALDSAPYLLLFGDELTLKAYQENYPARLAARTQLSLATTKGASDDDKSFRIALGFRMTPYDLGDPRMGDIDDQDTLLGCYYGSLKPIHDETNRLVQALAPAVVEGRTLTPDEEAAWRAQLESNRAVPDRLRGCRDRFRVRDWNASSWSLGVAPTWTGPDGGVDDLEWSGAALWSSFAYGFEGIPGLQDSGQSIFHVRYRPDDLVPDPGNEGDFIDQDTLVIGLQTRVAGPDNVLGRAFLGGPDLNFLLDLSYTATDPDDGDDDDIFRYAFGVESQITCDLYLKISLGSETGGDDDQAFALGSLNFGFSGQRSQGFLPAGSAACEE
ncbi:MAG TPA: hypothetical protein VLE23_17250 [Geminicoccaceae bacterium]|nr:hypothetical protein [Geminicoccaceae bacterium]